MRSSPRCSRPGVTVGAVLIGRDDGDVGDVAGQVQEVDEPDRTPAFAAEDLVEPPTTRWITNGGTIWNQRYSPLDQIDTESVDELRGVWRARLESGIEAKYSGEAQILYYDRRLYVVTGANDVIAVNAVDGAELWRYRANSSRRSTPSAAAGRAAASGSATGASSSAS